MATVPSLAPVWRRWRVVIIVFAAAWVLATAAAVATVLPKLRPQPVPIGSLPHDLGVAPPTAQAAFVDGEHGYLLLGRCPTPRCETWVAVTHDGGRSWDGAIVPGLTFSLDDLHDAASPRLIALDAQHAVLDLAGDLVLSQNEEITERGQR